MDDDEERYGLAGKPISRCSFLATDTKLPRAAGLKMLPADCRWA